MTAVATAPVTEPTVASAYRVQFIDIEGKFVRTERLSAASDDEALALAPAMTNGNNVELWDGLSFLEYFDAAHRHL